LDFGHISFVVVTCRCWYRTLRFLFGSVRNFVGDDSLDEVRNFLFEDCLADLTSSRVAGVANRRLDGCCRRPGQILLLWFWKL
jgi:hypothetical protein